MINKKVIAALYSKYSRPPQNFDALEIDKLIATCGEIYGIKLDETHITFENMDEGAPFRSILLRNLCGVVLFFRHVAIVTPSYILFLDQEQYDVNIHFKPESRTWWERLYTWIKS